MEETVSYFNSYTFLALLSHYYLFGTVVSDEAFVYKALNMQAQIGGHSSLAVRV